jgi:hypothetical protein
MRINLLVALLTTLLLIGIISSKKSSLFEENNILEMNKLNSAALFKTYPYMVALVTEDMDCSTSQCQEAIELLLKSSKEISYKFPLQPVWINSKDNKLLAKKLRVVETECLVYLANNKAVVYYEDWELKSLNIWIKKRMILPSIAYSKHD